MARSAPVAGIGHEPNNAGLADAQFKAKLTELGSTILAGLPADVGKFLASETEKWAKAVRFAHIKAE